MLRVERGVVCDAGFMSAASARAPLTCSPLRPLRHRWVREGAACTGEQVSGGEWMGHPGSQGTAAGEMGVWASRVHFLALLSISTGHVGFIDLGM